MVPELAASESPGNLLEAKPGDYSRPPKSEMWAQSWTTCVLTSKSPSRWFRCPLRFEKLWFSTERRSCALFLPCSATSSRATFSLLSEEGCQAPAYKTPWEARLYGLSVFRECPSPEQAAVGIPHRREMIVDSSSEGQSEPHSGEKGEISLF